jgi:hypothetical protein
MSFSRDPAQEATPPEHAQDELVERDLHVGLVVAHLLLGAEALNAGDVRVIGLRVLLEHALGHRDLALLAALAVVHADVAGELRGAVLGVGQVEHERLEPVVPEDVDALLEAGRVVQVGEQHPRGRGACVARRRS